MKFNYLARLLTALALVLLPLGAVAQNAPNQNFYPTGQASLAVTTASAAVALGSNQTSSPSATTVVITNQGTVDARVLLGGPSCTATIGNYLVPAGSVRAWYIGSQVYLCAITAAGSTTLDVATGTGFPAGWSSPGAGGSSGSATQGTTPWIVAGGGTAGAPGTAALTTQGIIGGTPNPISATSGAFADGALVTLGAKADAKFSATDATPITAMQVLKELSYLLQGNGTIGQAGAPWTATLPPSLINGSGSVQHSSAGGTTAYAANQLFANNSSGNAAATQVTVTATNGGTGFITHARIEDSGTGATAPPGYTIYLFSAAPTTTSLVDYSTYIGPYAADLTGGVYLGSLTCAAFVKTNDGTAQWWSPCTTSNLIIGPLPFQAVSGHVYVNALVAVNAAYTPISGETLTIQLDTTRDN